MQVTAGVLVDWVGYTAGGVGLAASLYAMYRTRRNFGINWFALVLISVAFLFMMQNVQAPLLQTGLLRHFVGAGLLVLAFGPSFATATLALVVLAQGLLLIRVDFLAALANLFNLAVVAPWVIHALNYELVKHGCPLYISAFISIFLGSLFSSLLAVFEWSLGMVNRVLLLVPLGSAALQLALLETTLCLLLWLMLRRSGLQRYYESLPRRRANRRERRRKRDDDVKRR